MEAAVALAVEVVVVGERTMGCGEKGLLEGVAGEAQEVVVVVVALGTRLGCGGKPLGGGVAKEEHGVVEVVMVLGGRVAAVDGGRGTRR